MIENKLTENEFRRLITVFVRIADEQTLFEELNSIFSIEAQRLQDFSGQNKILVSYKDYRVDIRDLRDISGRGYAVTIQFKAKQKWTHGLIRDQNKRIVNEISALCKKEIKGLTLRRYTRTVPGDPFLDEGPFQIVMIHDSQAFNHDWKEARDISPLLISPDAHHGNCFVEFQFNPGGYERQGNTTLLRNDWNDYSSAVSGGIMEDAKRLFSD